SKGKLIALLSYVTIFGALLAIFLNVERKNPFVAFHTRQGLGLWITYMLIGLIIYPLDILMVYYAFWLFIGALIINGMIGAISGKLYSVPFFGGYYQKILKSIGG
ncbi:MAG: hypothetical protein R3213_03800, partial [Flavobacteriaceae bacterium]|nr:hypothetical protein [Flavobacteriaceae bacterium]